MLLSFPYSKVRLIASSIPDVGNDFPEANTLERIAIAYSRALVARISSRRQPSISDQDNTYLACKFLG